MDAQHLSLFQRKRQALIQTRISQMIDSLHHRWAYNVAGHLMIASGGRFCHGTGTAQYATKWAQTLALLRAIGTENK